MNIIVGGIIKKDNKYLLVKEAKEEYYGMYNIPAGHLDEGELLIDGAKREIKEETGYDVNITGIIQIASTKECLILIFMGNPISKQGDYDKAEILSTNWLTYEEIIKIKDKLRAPKLLVEAIKCEKENKIYSLELIKN